LDFFPRRTDGAFFTETFRFFPSIIFAAIIFHAPLTTANARSIQCPAGGIAPKYAGDGLRILSVIDHNEQQRTLHIGKISPDDANGSN
jgi:hypothetical protein